MNDTPGAANDAALLPATDAGNTMAVTAEPATVVPGSASMSTVAGAPMSASASKIAVPPPTGCALNLICDGAELTNEERVYGATFAHVAVVGSVAVDA